MFGKQIAVLYPGGTIGMIAGPGGLHPTGAFVAEVEAWIARHEHLAAHEFRVERIEPLIDSAALAPSTWLRLAGRIWEMQDAAVLTEGRTGRQEIKAFIRHDWFGVRPPTVRMFRQVREAFRSLEREGA